MNKVHKNKHKKRKLVEEITKIYSDKQSALFDLLSDRKIKGKLKLKPIPQKTIDLNKLSEQEECLSDLNHAAYSTTTKKDDLNNTEAKLDITSAAQTKNSSSFSVGPKSDTNHNKKLEQQLKITIHKSKSPHVTKNQLRPRNLSPIKNNHAHTMRASADFQPKTDVREYYKNDQRGSTHRGLNNSIELHKRSKSIQAESTSLQNSGSESLQKKKLKSIVQKAPGNSDENTVHSPRLEKDVFKALNKLDSVIQQSKERYFQKQIGHTNNNKPLDKVETPKIKKNVTIFKNNSGFLRESPRLENSNKSMINDTSSHNLVLNSSMVSVNRLQTTTISPTTKLKFEYNMDREKVLGKIFKPLNDTGEKNTLGGLEMKRNLMTKAGNMNSSI